VSNRPLRVLKVGREKGCGRKYPPHPLCPLVALYVFFGVTGMERPSEGPNEGKTPALGDIQARALLEVCGIFESPTSLLTDAIRKQWDPLQETLKNVYQGAPRTITKAYSAA
jgi:hypothetical protein